MEIAFISPGVLTDGGGYVIYIGSDGNVHVKKIPPWDPETLGELQVAVAVLDGVGAIRNEAVAAQFLKVAEGVVAKHAGALQKAVAE